MRPLEMALLVVSALATLASAGLFAMDRPGWDLVALLVAALTFAASRVLRDARTGTLVTALVALCCNLYLLAAKVAAKAGPSRCSINELLDCDKVNLSPASELYGIPVTLIGAAFYSGLVVASLAEDTKASRLHQVTALFSLLATGYSGWLAWQSKLIGAWCVVCITIYLANLVLVWAGLRGLANENRKLFDDLGSIPRSSGLLTVSGTFAVLLLLGFVGYRGRTADPLATVSGTQLRDADVLARLYATPAGTVTLDGTEPIYGDPNAPYLLVEFADYGCPHCADAAPELKRVVDERPEIQLRFKVYPRTGECNPALQPTGYVALCRAAYAAECARRSDRFWEMNALLFANYANHEDGELRFMAERQLGLDGDAFIACLDDPTIHAGVVADAEAGRMAGVIGTPTLYLRGTHGDRWIELTMGPLAALRVVEAHLDGVELPPPGPPLEHE